MAIPTYDKLLRPVLELASQQPITRRTATPVMGQRYALTQEELDARIPSGNQTYIASRTGWAMTFLTKAGLIVKTAPATYQASDLGREFLRLHPDEITVADLRTIKGWREAWGDSDKGSDHATGNVTDTVSAQTSPPHEVIASQVSALRADLRGRLLQSILDQAPEFFEQLVLDVLTAMGYGGSREAAAQHVGRTGDEGIDGRINQDALGLDQVLVQAKRYHPDNVVGRPAIQAFIGAMAGQGVNKGIFITTSSFGENAREFVLRGSNMKIVLVDGSTLIDLMLRHGIGVRVAHRYEIHELDQNYFEEGD